MNFNLSEDQRQACSPTSRQRLEQHNTNSRSIQNVVAMQSNRVYKSSFFVNVQHKASCQPADKENLLQVVKGEELEDHGEKLVGQLGVDRHESRRGSCLQRHVALTEWSVIDKYSTRFMVSNIFLELLRLRQGLWIVYKEGREDRVASKLASWR